MACALPALLGLPLSRLQVPDIRAELLRRGLVAEDQRGHHLALAVG